MARKSVVTERRKEILDAFEICIVKYGFHTTTLEQIAQHSGIKRPAIRHFIGNRDEVRKAHLEQIINEAKAHVKQLENITINFENTTQATITALITQAITASPSRLIVLSHYFVLSQGDLVIRRLVQKWHSTYIHWIVEALKANKINTNTKAIETMASGILATCVGLAALSPVLSAQANEKIVQSITGQIRLL